MKRIAWPAMAMLFIVTVFIGCERRKAEELLDAVRVQLGWTHQAQWAGFYAVDKNGYYAEERLAVELLPRPSPTTNTIALVMDGAADFEHQTPGLPYPGQASDGSVNRALCPIRLYRDAHEYPAFRIPGRGENPRQYRPQPGAERKIY